MIGLRKRHLKITRHKFSLLDLGGKCPHRALDGLAHPTGQVTVSHVLKRSGIFAPGNRVIHALLNPRLTRLFGQIVPGIRRPADALRKMPQCVMIDISHIHAGKLLQFPLRQSQSVGHVMRKRTLRKLLQPCDTVLQFRAV